MRYILRENLSATSGVASNLHGFLHVFNDHGFRNKWTGYWSPPHKFLDYFSFRVNGVWLDRETLHCTEYGPGYVFHHDTGSLEIEERIETPPGLPGFQVMLEINNPSDEPKAVRTSLELGVDIRHRSDDLGPESYGQERHGRRLTVSGNGKKLMVSPTEDFDIEGEQRVKEHQPGEKQRCHVPGRIVFSQEIQPRSSHRLGVEMSTSDGSFGSLPDREEQQLEHGKLGRCFRESVDSMENLVYDRNGKGIIAGHPWFQSYWARDSFWTLLGMIDAGHFELSHQVLENYVEHGLSSRIFLAEDGDEFPRADTAPLFIMACDKLRRHHRINLALEDAMEDAMERLELEENLVRHEPEATWMDTLERPGAVDIQSLWLEAARINGDAREEKLEKGLQNFQNGEYMRDHLSGDASHTINPAVPLMLGQVEREKAEKYLEKINAEFSSRYGARTRSMADPGYSSDGYHTGSSWGLTTAWAAAANLKYGKQKQGSNLLEKMTQFLDRNQVGALPEVVDSESGELIGASEQAWSAGLFVHVIDTYLLGIEVTQDGVEIDPADISCVRRNKKIRGETLDIQVEDGKAEVMNSPDLDIEL